jgi:uridine kinase
MSAETYLIGIAGPSGAGKSHLAKHLAQQLPALILSLDRYYRDLSRLQPSERAMANFDAPDALEHELLIEQVRRLRLGEAVPLPVYDFATHMRTGDAELMRPGDVLIVEGLFTLYWLELRTLLDTKVYVDMTDGVCLKRRIERDVRERARTPQSVVEQYTATVGPMAQRYVRPTRAHADVTVSGDDPIEEMVTRVMAHHRQIRAEDPVR